MLYFEIMRFTPYWVWLAFVGYFPRLKDYHLLPFWHFFKLLCLMFIIICYLHPFLKLILHISWYMTFPIILNSIYFMIMCKVVLEISMFLLYSPYCLHHKQNKCNFSIVHCNSIIYVAYNVDGYDLNFFLWY